jgi:hexosaminidase
VRGKNKAGYQFTATKRSIVISAPTAAGVFYGVQSFYQLLPPEMEKNELVSGITWKETSEYG